MSDNWNMQPPPTPAKGEAMPQTQEYWEKRALMDQELILEMKAQISLLKTKNNKLQQENAHLNRIIQVMDRREN